MNDHDAFYADVGRRIRQARIKIGQTQEGLASLVGLTRTSIVNIEKGRQKILLHTLVDIATSLQTPSVDLLPSSNPSSKLELDTLLEGQSQKTREWVKSAVGSDKKEKKHGR